MSSAQLIDETTDYVKVTVLGSGLATTYPGLEYRYPASHLVQTKDQKILLDVGIGVLPQLAKVGLQLTDITVICISHYHADHFAIEPIPQAFYLLAMTAGKKSDLQILGPSDIEERVKAGYRLKGWTFENDLLQHMNITFRPYQDGQPITVAPGVHITPFKTKHFALEAYALRVESESVVVAYSGDSTATSGLEAAAKRATVFLCEAAIGVGKQPNEGHISPREAGIIAKDAQSERLILIHYSGTDTPAAMIDDVKATGFTGKIDVAKDLGVYS